MADVFISYAREDVKFVRRLHEALADRDRQTWVDWEKIPKGAEWLAEIYAGIDSAEAFLFVISPDSVTSSVCGNELQHAVERNKRLFPIVWREAEGESVDNTLAKLNWIFFRDSDNFDASLGDLLTALDTDLDWVRVHTRLLVRAVEWEKQNRETSYTLRGPNLKDAEEWLVRAADKEPKPIGLQTEYVLASRKAVTVRQRITFGAIAFGMIVAVALSVVAYFQNQEKMRQQKIALARQLINQAEALRDPPPDEPDARDSLEESVRAAVQALAHFNDLGMRSVEADQAVREGMALLPKLVGEHDPKLGEIKASAFTPTGQFLAIADNRSQVVVWDVVRERQVAGWNLALPAMKSILAVDISVDGAYLATLTYDASPGVNVSTVTIWQLPDGTPRKRFQRQGRLEKLRLSSRGEYAYVFGSGSLWGWNIADGEQLAPVVDGQFIYDLAFSPDGQHKAVTFRKKDTRDYVVRIEDVKTGEEKQRWEEQERIESLRWTTDSKMVLVGTKATVLSRDATTGNLDISYRLDGSGLMLSPDRRLVAQRLKNYTVQVRSATSGHESFRLTHDTEVKAMTFRPDSDSIVTLSAVDRKIRVWKLGGSRWFVDLSHDDPLTRVDFSVDGELLFTGSAADTRWWRLPAKNEALEPPRQSSDSGQAAILSQFRARTSGWPISAGEKNRVDISNGNGRHLKSVEFPSPVVGAAVSRDGDRLAVATGTITRGGWELSLEIWDLNRHKRLDALPYPRLVEDAYRGIISFSSDDRFIVTGSQEGFTLWNAGKLAQVATVYHAAPRTIAFQPYGTLVATSGRDQKIRIWEPISKLEVARIVATEPVQGLVLSPDGRWLTTLSVEGVAQLWLLQPSDVIAQACARLRAPCP
jgi:WD40 repeat protein